MPLMPSEAFAVVLTTTSRAAADERARPSDGRTGGGLVARLRTVLGANRVAHAARWVVVQDGLRELAYGLSLEQAQVRRLDVVHDQVGHELAPATERVAHGLGIEALAGDDERGL